MSKQLERKYGLFTAICMVVGIVIGSGVFFKAQTILTKTGGDMPLGILAWLIGGAIMSVVVTVFFPQGFTLAVFGAPAFYVSAVVFVGMLILAFKKVHPILIVCISAVLGIAAGYLGFL